MWPRTPCSPWRISRLDGALIVVSADDPGMASSQNEQDNRRYALAAGVPMLEPSDSQEAYEFTLRAIEISERWQVPVLLRMTTRVCHSKTIVRRGTVAIPPPRPPHFEHDLPSRVMIPAYARPAHRRLRKNWRRLPRGTTRRDRTNSSPARPSWESSPRALPSSMCARPRRRPAY